MTHETRQKLNGYAGWVLALITVAGLLVGLGGLRGEIVVATETNAKQDAIINKLAIDVAVTRSITEQTLSDVREIKQALRRP